MASVRKGPANADRNAKRRVRCPIEARPAQSQSSKMLLHFVLSGVSQSSRDEVDRTSCVGGRIAGNRESPAVAPLINPEATAR